ncbi:hypothetical protein KL906_005436 [Ogataea polymorpha]|nr:hypothetical protein KL936_005435 [Ogataea polymorpha]KAG7905073.1 hypothetical protein KL906_005436 [Ogataea polymorpha]KAG7912930.1 hypothetical protein KL927_005431 [Ogataea polymorpha]KAG7925882.1 hypothetical protein KL934_005415 [Ogataea polymorpha]
MIRSTEFAKQLKANQEGEMKKSMEFDEDEFPEGGFGWFVVLASWCGMACTFGMVNSFGVYQSFYQTELYSGEKTFKINIIGSLQPACMYFFCTATVYLHHYFGVQLTVALGAFIQVFSLMMMSITNSIWQLFLTQGVLFGFGSGIIYFSALTIPMHWFKRKKAFAIGIASSGSSIGGVIWPIAVRRLISEVGVNWTNRILGFIYIPVAVILLLFLRPRLPVKLQETDYFLSLYRFRFYYDLTILKSRKYLILLFAFIISQMALFPGLFLTDLYGQRLAHKLHRSLFDPAYYVTLLNAASLFGRILPGFLADVFGRLNVLIPFMLLSGILPLSLWLNSSSSDIVFLIFDVTWGFSSGVVISLFPTLVPQLFGIEKNQSRMGILFTLAGIGALFGPIICGAFLPLAGSVEQYITDFKRVAIFIGVLFLVAGGSLCSLRLLISKSLFQIL